MYAVAWIDATEYVDKFLEPKFADRCLTEPDKQSIVLHVTKTEVCDAKTVKVAACANYLAART